MHTRGLQFLVGLVVFCLSSSAHARHIEYWSWYTFNLRKWQWAQFSTYAEFRVTEDFASEPSLLLISPKMTFPVHRNLSLVASYTYISSKRTTAVSDIHDRHRSQHRFELEVDPQIQVAKGVKFHSRNRLELRRIEDADGWRNRMRNRLQVEVPVKLGAGIIEGVYFDNEFFFDFYNHSYNENRMVPIGIITRLNRAVKLRFYYMRRSTKSSDTWSTDQVAGTFLTMSF